MYHILQAQGQIQFRSAEHADDPWRRPQMPGQAQQLAPPVVGPVRSLDQRGDPARPQRFPHDLESAGKLAGAPRKAEAAQQATLQQSFDAIGQIGVRLQTLARRLGEEAAPGGGLDARAVRRHPEAAAREPAGEVGRDRAVGTLDEADQSVLVANLARDDVAPLARGLRMGLRSAGPGRGRRCERVVWDAGSWCFDEKALRTLGLDHDANIMI